MVGEKGGAGRQRRGDGAGGAGIVGATRGTAAAGRFFRNLMTFMLIFMSTPVGLLDGVVAMVLPWYCGRHWVGTMFGPESGVTRSSRISLRCSTV